MTGLFRLILSLFIGGAIGLVLMLISESIVILLSSGVVALFTAAFLYRLNSIKKELKGLLAAAGAIVAFFAYFMLLNALNERSGSLLFALIFFFGPFVALVYTYALSKSMSDDGENKSE